MTMPKYFYIKYFIMVLILGTVTADTKAQKIEVGVLVGGSYYYGDIVNDWQPNTISSAAGVFLRYHLSENLTVKGFGGYCRIGGADSNSTGSSYQKNRNLAFWADVYEGSVQFEYSFVKDITRGRRLRNRFIPYVFAGLGAFYYMNYANDPLYPLIPAKLWQLGTSGTVYSQLSACIPFGAGVRYKITSNFNIGLEVGIRYTLTSWLDDVGGPTTFFVPEKQLLNGQSKIMSDRSVEQGYLYSGRQRGKIATNDIYVMGGLTLSYRFGTSGGGGGGYRGRAIRCPRFY
jgi:Domain of unknown function (DUF6089)